jgi:hypothetical protein
LGAPDLLSLQSTAEVFRAFRIWLYTKAVIVDGLDFDGGSDDEKDADADEGANKRASEISVVGIPERSLGGSNPTAANNNDDAQKLWYSNLKQRGRVFARLLDLYIFGDTYEIPPFKTAIMLEWQKFSTSQETLPCPTIVKHALDHLDINSSLCQFLILCYGYYTDYFTVNKGRFATLPSAFLTEVLMVTFARLGRGVESWDEDWCRFHDHRDKEEREACEANREEQIGFRTFCC